MKFEWEFLLKDKSPVGCRSTSRARVFGGWVLKHVIYLEEIGQSESMVFIPDPSHQWSITEY